MRCKIGDDAIIIRSLNDENIGKMVKVIGYVGDFYQMQNYDIGDGLEREAIVDGVHWKIAGNGCKLVSIHQTPLDFAIIADSWLQPIRGTPTDDSTTEIKDKQLETTS